MVYGLFIFFFFFRAQYVTSILAVRTTGSKSISLYLRRSIFLDITIVLSFLKFDINQTDERLIQLSFKYVLSNVHNKAESSMQS